MHIFAVRYTISYRRLMWINDNIQTSVVLSSRDPHPIAEIPSDPRLIPYHSPNSVPTIPPRL